MGVPYDSFIGAFLSKITDYDLADIDRRYEITVRCHLADTVFVLIEHGSTYHDAVLDTIGIKHLPVRSHLNGINIGGGIKTFVQQQRLGV